VASEIKVAFLNELATRYGLLRKLDRSQSLYEIRDSSARIYIRYSRTHERNRTFYGLRRGDLRQLEGHPSIICFLWDGQRDPLLIPFSDYEEVFQSTSPAADGQYKVQVYLQSSGTELYIAQAGRFNVEGNFGWAGIEAQTGLARRESMPELSHSQMQTLLGAIGALKGYDIWVPIIDRPKLDWLITNPFRCRDVTLYGFQPAERILQQVDVIWLQKGSSEPRAMFEVEHSTPIYSGLLRFNDIHLVAPQLRPTFSIVANDARRDLFVRQLNRPTFRLSGLNEICTFLDYVNVLEWYTRLRPESEKHASGTSELT